LNRFAIAFSPEDKRIALKIIEAANAKEALRSFFDYFVEGYSKDSEGYAWFSDDFEDGMGVIVEI
jgi:DTW domain-containing protein YfiP